MSEKKYSFEYESKMTVEGIYKNLQQQYKDMQLYCEKYNMRLGNTLDTIEKFYEFFDNEGYYNVQQNFYKREYPQVDYTLYVMDEDTLNTSNCIFLPKGLANKFDMSKISQHYDPVSGTYFHTLIKNYLEYYYLLDKTFGNWVCLDIESWILDNSKGRKLPNIEFAKATKLEEKRRNDLINMTANFVKQLKINLKENGKALDEEDLQMLRELIEKYM